MPLVRGYPTTWARGAHFPLRGTYHAMIRVQFAKRELLTEHWMRALSLEATAAPSSLYELAAVCAWCLHVHDCVMIVCFGLGLCAQCLLCRQDVSLRHPTDNSNRKDHGPLGVSLTCTYAPDPCASLSPPQKKVW